LKKNPSQVAQAETPNPMSSFSAGSPNSFAEAPVATISTLAKNSSPSAVTTWNGRRRKSTFSAWEKSSLAPNRWAWVRMRSMSSGPWIPSGKPGKFSTSVVMVSCPPGCIPSMTTGANSARAA